MKHSYFVVKRSLLSKLINLVNPENLFELIRLNDIRTIWHDEIVNEKDSTKEGMVTVPNDFIEISKLNMLEWNIMHDIIIMENGYDIIKNF